MKIIETYKSRTEEERRKNVTDVIVALENNSRLRNKTYINDEKTQEEIV